MKIRRQIRFFPVVLAEVTILSACAMERDETRIMSTGLDIASVSPMPQIAASSPRLTADQIRNEGSDRLIDQVEPDSRIAGDASPENDLARDVPSNAPDLALYREVALAWQAIRARGQQPSPELLAQAVGPDNLATFLSTFRDADRMFRPDVDSWPVAPVGGKDLPPTPEGPK